MPKRINFFEIENKIKIQSHFAKSNNDSFAEFVVGNNFFICEAWSKQTIVREGAVANYDLWSDDSYLINSSEICYIAFCKMIRAVKQLESRLNRKYKTPDISVELVFYKRQPFMKNKFNKIANQ